MTGIPEGGAGTDIFYDNVRITPHKKNKEANGKISTGVVPCPK